MRGGARREEDQRCDQATNTPPITDEDIDYFAPYVDATKRHFKTPPFSPRHFRLVRRMALVRSNNLEGAVRTYFVAPIDISTSACCASSSEILAADEPKANALIAAHARWIGQGPPFLAPIPTQLVALTSTGLSMLGS